MSVPRCPVRSRCRRPGLFPSAARARPPRRADYRSGRRQHALAYTRITAHHQHPTLVGPHGIDKPVKRVSVAAPAGQLAALVTRIESASALTVVVFRSDNPAYFMAHWDLLSDKNRVATMKPGPTGLHPYLDNLVRLSKVPVATISAIRGRARAAYPGVDR